MGENTIGLASLRFIYFTGENKSITNGPKCHLCMNEAFRSDELQDVDHVFVMAETGLVPFLIRSLVFLHGTDTPFSLKNIWERHLKAKCLHCPARRNILLTRQEIYQKRPAQHKSTIKHVISEGVKSLRLVTATPVESTEISPSITSSEKKRRISSDDSEIDAKKVKEEVDEEFPPKMTLRWGNIPHDQVQPDATHNENQEDLTKLAADFKQQNIQPLTIKVRRKTEEPADVVVCPLRKCLIYNRLNAGNTRVLDERHEEIDSVQPGVSKTSKKKLVIEPPSLDGPYSQCQDRQPSTSNCITRSSNSDSEATLHTRSQNKSNSGVIVEIRTMRSEEWFPFLTGRCPSTVSDHITTSAKLFDGTLSSLCGIGRCYKGVLDFLMRKYFDIEKDIVCPACNKAIPLRGGFYHFITKAHFLSVRQQNRVFSNSLDLLKFRELVNEAKREIDLQTWTTNISVSKPNRLMDINLEGANFSRRLNCIPGARPIEMSRGAQAAVHNRQTNSYGRLQQTRYLSRYSTAFPYETVAQAAAFHNNRPPPLEITPEVRIKLLRSLMYRKEKQMAIRNRTYSDGSGDFT